MTAQNNRNPLPTWLALALNLAVGELAPTASTNQPIARLVREYSVRLDSRTTPVKLRKNKARRTKRGFFTFDQE